MTSTRARTRARSLFLLAVPAAPLAASAAPPGIALADTGAPTGAAHGSSDEQVLNYVALGDSYASGFGLEHYSDQAPGCFQSENDYPRRVAASFDLRLTDVTCAGATTHNVIDTPQKTPTGDLAPAQSDALSVDTDLVTLTIGGNDLGFSTVLPQCLAATANGPLLAAPNLADCQSAFTSGGVDQIAAALERVVLPDVERTLATIAEKAPNAEVVVVGYPTIFPSADSVPEGGCFVSAIGTGEAPFPQDAFPFTETDTAWLHGVQVALDQGLARVAGEQDARYVSPLAATDGHSPCGSNDDAWLTGLAFTQLQPSPAIAEGGLHPNDAGVGYLAERVERVIESTR